MNFKELTLILALSTTVLGKDNYSDENRPYEFGFKIDGEQHRHEKKDKNGIINGEFGFITADGVYHVTVYATDENGNYKIISMKNIRVKPYPTLNAHNNGRSQTQIAATTPVTSPVPVTTQPSRSCSQCRGSQSPSVTSQTNNKKILTPADVKYLENPVSNISPNNPAISGKNIRLNPSLNQGSNYETHFNVGKNPINQQAPGSGQVIHQSIENNESNRGENNKNLHTNRATGARNINIVNSANKNVSNGITKTFNFDEEILKASEDPQFAKRKGNQPVLVAAQMKSVPKSPKIYTKQPEERDGLPIGLEKKDMEKILYKFNYTLGFYGHEEEGYVSGSKKGHYFITGRNGERLRVDYVADENGFRPKITKEVLDVLSDEVPKPETEKDEKYAGLKHYEFNWIYFPRN